MHRSNPYEAAFAAWLRDRRVPHVAVDEARRALWGEQSLKSLDFLVSTGGPRGGWLVDVKGRKFPSGRRRQYWKNWCTDEELRSLARWEELFGGGFAGVLVFAYQVAGDLAPLPAERLFVHRGEAYGFVAVRLLHYAAWARPLSARWGTVRMPAARFRELAVPAEELLGAAPAMAASG